MSQKWLERSCAASRAGWSASRSSITIARAFTRPLARRVHPTMPCVGVRMHEAGEHPLALDLDHAGAAVACPAAAGCASLGGRDEGCSVPSRLATCQMVSPGAAATSRPSSVRNTRSGSDMGGPPGWILDHRRSEGERAETRHSDPGRSTWSAGTGETCSNLDPGREGRRRGTWRGFRRHVIRASAAASFFIKKPGEQCRGCGGGERPAGAGEHACAHDKDFARTARTIWPPTGPLTPLPPARLTP